MDCGVSTIFDIIHFFNEKYILDDELIKFLNEVIIPLKFDLKQSNKKVRI